MFRLVVFLGVLLSASIANAQYSASKDAQYMATVKAVANFKIEDEEISRDIAKLRQNKAFNEKLQKMLEKLSNRRTKDTTNRKVLQILEEAGEQIYKLLD